MPDKIFNDVKFTAEQVTEIHRTLENDHTVTEVELPGVVNVYLEIEGGRLLFTQYKAGKVLDAIEAAGKAQAQSSQANGEPETAEPPADEPSATA
jgi:electron transfer flavoprotein alpha/beta subunit